MVPGKSEDGANMASMMPWTVMSLGERVSPSSSTSSQSPSSCYGETIKGQLMEYSLDPLEPEKREEDAE